LPCLSPFAQDFFHTHRVDETAMRTFAGARSAAAQVWVTTSAIRVTQKRKLLMNRARFFIFIALYPGGRSNARDLADAIGAVLLHAARGSI
jgi:hypothetical protein